MILQPRVEGRAQHPGPDGMTETTTTITEAACDSGVPIHPTDILIALIVAFLTPMFLGGSGGDVGFARKAALETLNAYRIRNQADLLAVAQIVGFGLAVLGSLSLSMAEDISLAMTLRLRGNANALHRSAEQIRRARELSGGARAVPDRRAAAVRPEPPAAPAHDPVREAALVANVAATQRQAAAALARMGRPEQPPVHVSSPTPAAAPVVSPAAAPAVSPAAAPAVVPAVAPITGSAAVPAPTQAAAIGMTPGMSPGTNEEQARRAMWASAMADVASEYTASLATLPPEERHAASTRAAVLTRTAKTLLSGSEVPPSILPSRAAVTRPGTT
jgi:hypothetical protein